MNDLHELESELGPHLRRVLDTIVPSELVEFRDHEPLGSPPAIAGPARRELAPIEASDVRHHSRRVVAIAAASIAIVGLAGVMAVVGRASEEAPAAPVESGAPTVAPGSTVTSTIVGGSVPPTDLPGVFLPTEDLAGFTLTEISATRAQLGFDGRHVVRYVRQDAGGSVEAMIELTAQQAAPSNENASEGPITVHGQPADIFDSGEGIVVTWEEAGVSATVRTWGMSWDESAALAERSTVDAATTLLGIDGLDGDGFVVSVSDELAPPDAAMVNIHYSADDRRAGGFVDVASWINDDAISLEVLEARARMAGQTVERTIVADRPALITTTSVGTFGPIVSVQWLRDGFILVVSGRAAADELSTFAASVGPATLDDARALRATVDATMRALPVLDTAVLPNGFHVTIRTTGSGANVVCLDDPVGMCEPVINESSLAGEIQTAVTATFHVDGTTWIVGWAEGTHQPVRTGAGSADTAPISDTAQGDFGTFATVALTSDDDQIKFDVDSPTSHGALSGGFENDLLKS